jgi:hypothetical protein
MRFEKGNQLSKGRPKGAVNRSTEMMKLNIARAVNNTLDTIQTDLAEIKKKDPVKAMELAMKLMEYTLPKLKSIDLNATMEIDQRIHSINVNINKSGSTE